MWVFPTRIVSARCYGVSSCLTVLTDKIERLLGQGTFGKVVQCYDKKDRCYVAIKIIRAIPKYRDASKIEIRVLNALRENDPHNLKWVKIPRPAKGLLTSSDAALNSKCIHMRECFDFRNHVCIVSELLGMSVFDFLKENAFYPFPASHIQDFARQLLRSVACKSETGWHASRSSLANMTSLSLAWSAAGTHWFKAWKYPSGQSFFQVDSFKGKLRYSLSF